MRIQSQHCIGESHSLGGDYSQYITESTEPLSCNSLDEAVLLDPHRSWSHGHLMEVVDDIQSWLLYLGVTPGSRVMLVSEHCRAVIAILFAVARLRALPVFVDPHLGPDEFDRASKQFCPYRILFVLESQSVRAHADRYNVTIANALDWGPVAFSEARRDNRDQCPEKAAR
jgi:long-chain acyl-CoA synthetase